MDLRRLAVKLWKASKNTVAAFFPSRNSGKQKKRACRPARPRRFHGWIGERRQASSGGRSRRRFRSRRGIRLALAAPERLQTEFGDLLGPAAEVLLDPLAQHGRQQPHVRERTVDLL